MVQQALDRIADSPGETTSQGSAQTAAQQRNRVRHTPAGAGPAYWGFAGLMTFLVTGEHTGGAFFLAEISVAPGAGTAPHIHSREDESFQLLEGSLTLQVGGNTITASAGDFVFLPRGLAHSFKNTAQGSAKALVLTTPAGLEGFFAEVFEPALDRSATPPPPSRELIARAQAASQRYGLELLPRA